MFFILSKVLDFFLSPLVWIILLLLLGLLLKSPRLKKKFLYTGCILLLIFTNPFLAGLSFKAWEGVPIPMSSISNYETAIVLTGVASTRNTAEDRVFFGKGADRVLHAVQLLKAGKIKNILISGGSGTLVGKKTLEAIQLKKVFLFSGVPDSSIFIESNSRNTFENAQYSRKLIDSLHLRPRFLLITSAFHIPRATGCFSKAGIPVDPYATDFYSNQQTYTPGDLIIPRENALLMWSVLIHEICGFYTYRLIGYT